MYVRERKADRRKAGRIRTRRGKIFGKGWENMGLESMGRG
jgi:hypothetical protein